jgi:hypothetical protein
MALSAETQAWLDDLKKTGGISDEAFATLRATLESNSKADEFVKGSALRQSDYSRRMAEVQAAQQTLEAAQAALKAKEAEVTNFQTQLGQWKASAEPKFQQALAAQEAAERRVAAATARLKALAIANGLDENEVLKDIEAPPNPNPQNSQNPPQNPPLDTTKFVTKDDMIRGVRESALVDATIYDLGNEHQALFGKPLPNAAQLVAEAVQAGKPLRTFWEEKYKVPEKRNELQEASIQERIKAGVEAELAKRISEGALAPSVAGRDDLKGSPVFSKPLTAPTDAGGGGVSAAVAAFQAGKYKQYKQ